MCVDAMAHARHRRAHLRAPRRPAGRPRRAGGPIRRLREMAHAGDRRAAGGLRGARQPAGEPEPGQHATSAAARGGERCRACVGDLRRDRPAGRPGAGAAQRGLHGAARRRPDHRDAGHVVGAGHARRRSRPSSPRSATSTAPRCSATPATRSRPSGSSLRRRRLFGRQRMPQSRAEAEYHLARSLLAHDPVRARPVAARAARRFRTLGSDSWASRAEAVRMRAELSGGQVMRTGHHVPRSAPRSRPRRGRRVTSHDLERFGFGSDAAALRMTHELWRARRRRHPRRRRPGHPRSRRPRRWRCACSPTRCARRARPRAGATARPAATPPRGSTSSRRGWATSAASTCRRRPSCRATGSSASGSDSAVRSGRPDVVFEWSEWARHMSSQVVPLRPPPDEQLAEDLAELRDAAQRGRRLAVRPARARAARAGARASVVDDGLRRGPAARRRSTRCARALDDETALLSYVFSGDSLTVLVVTALAA